MDISFGSDSVSDVDGAVEVVNIVGSCGDGLDVDEVCDGYVVGGLVGLCRVEATVWPTARVPVHADGGLSSPFVVSLSGGLELVLELDMLEFVLEIGNNRLCESFQLQVGVEI